MTTKYTKQVHDVIVKAVRNDVPNIDAAALARVSEWTFYRWFKQGEEDAKAGIKSDMAKFYEDLKLAESEAITESLNLIKKAGKDPKRWQARAWTLERCYKKKFSPQGDALEKFEAQIKELTDAVSKITEPKALKTLQNVDDDEDNKEEIPAN